MKMTSVDQLFDCDLTPQSLVWNVGGFDGSFASQIHDKYKCTVEVFEPMPDFAWNLDVKFQGNRKIIVHHFGLGGRDGTCRMFWKGSMSGIHCDGKSFTVLVKSINRFSDGLNKPIDLLEINIEGMEFELLESVIDEGIASRFRHIQVQFHGVVANNQQRKQEIREGLLKTHNLAFDDPWVWERYSLK